jgi:hypothetical protein
MAENSSTTGTSSDSGGISLEDAIGSLMGDGDFGSDDSAPAASPSDAAGAPPAERQGTAETPAPPEGTATPSERAGAPPADATKATPDAAAPAALTPPADDPLATAVPFTYTVNGEQKAFDGIRVLGEHGAIVEPQALELLQRRLGERDHLFETSRQQYAQVQQFERLSQWHQKDAEGKEQVLSGPEGLMTMRVQMGTLAAAYDTLAAVFSNPEQFAALVSVQAMPDGTQRIVPNKAELSNLLTRSDLAEARASTAVREHLTKLVGAVEPSAPAQTPDYTAAAPQIIDAAARTANVDAKALTDKDRAFLSAQFPRYVRTVTEADRRGNVTLKLGGPIVDESFTQLVKDRVELRTEVAKTLKSTTDASAENANRMAAALVGTRPPAAPARTAPQPTPDNSRATDADRAWDLRERLSAGRRSA